MDLFGETYVHFNVFVNKRSKTHTHTKPEKKTVNIKALNDHIHKKNKKNHPRFLAWCTVHYFFIFF